MVNGDFDPCFDFSHTGRIPISSGQFQVSIRRGGSYCCDVSKLVKTVVVRLVIERSLCCRIRQRVTALRVSWCFITKKEESGTRECSLLDL